MEGRKKMHQYYKSNPRHLLPLYPGFISTQFVFDHVESKELIGLYFDPYANHAVANIMRKMDYFPCLGLGKNQQGITEIPEDPPYRSSCSGVEKMPLG